MRAQCPKNHTQGHNLINLQNTFTYPHISRTSCLLLPSPCFKPASCCITRLLPAGALWYIFFSRLWHTPNPLRPVFLCFLSRAHEFRRNQRCRVFWEFKSFNDGSRKNSGSNRWGRVVEKGKMVREVARNPWRLWYRFGVWVRAIQRTGGVTRAVGWDFGYMEKLFEIVKHSGELSKKISGRRRWTLPWKQRFKTQYWKKI